MRKFMLPDVRASAETSIETSLEFPDRDLASAWHVDRALGRVTYDGIVVETTSILGEPVKHVVTRRVMQIPVPTRLIVDGWVAWMESMTFGESTGAEPQRRDVTSGGGDKPSCSRLVQGIPVEEVPPMVVTETIPPIVVPEVPSPKSTAHQSGRKVRRRPCYGWISDDMSEDDLIELPAMAASPELPGNFPIIDLLSGDGDDDDDGGGGGGGGDDDEEEGEEEEERSERVEEDLVLDACVPCGHVH